MNFFHKEIVRTRNLCKLFLPCLIFCCALMLNAGETPADLALLDALEKPSETWWKMNAGQNINCRMESGKKVSIGGNDITALELTFEKKAALNSERAENWFEINRTFAPEACWNGASGIGIKLAVKKTANWWLQIGLVCDGETFSTVPMPYDYRDNSIRNILLPFGDFKNINGKKIIPEKISRVSIMGPALPNSLYLAKIFLFTNKPMTHVVTFETNETGLNIFQPRQNVQMTFSVGNGAPANAKFLQYAVMDYFDQTVKTGDLPLSGETTYRVDFMPERSGYYEVNAYWLDAKGEKLSGESCIKTTGSLPQGRGTFAVMPNTLETNRKKMRAFGNTAFFGFHGGCKYPLVDLMGMTWRFGGGGRWIWDENQGKPTLIKGVAAWAAKRMLTETPAKNASWQGIFNQCMNISETFPEWAKTHPLGNAPGLKEPDDYFRYLGNCIKVYKHAYPHMTQRIYDIFWEVNLNEPKVGTHKPEYLPKDIITAYGEARKVVDSEDPGAILMGPCASSLEQLPWVEQLFKNGLLNCLDAYNCHGYHTPPPEEGGVIDNIRVLKKLMAKYNHGKLLDIYCTELGYRSQYGSEDRSREHAQWHARVAIILKGEGVKVYYPFYSYDFFGAHETWGVCYNLDPELNWDPERLSPKAAVPALAVCVNELEGTTPVSDLPFFGRDVWCYIFKDNQTGEPVIALWSVHETGTVAFPAGDVTELAVTNIMGHKSRAGVTNGIAALAVSPSPIYIRGAAKEIYINSKKLKTIFWPAFTQPRKEILTIMIFKET